MSTYRLNLRRIAVKPTSPVPSSQAAAGIGTGAAVLLRLIM
jgi:hypothetical protein